MKDLLVLKTTGSAFESFVRDEYTTLAEVNDRIFSTSIDLTYTFAPLPIPAPADGEGKVFDASKKQSSFEELSGLQREIEQWVMKQHARRPDREVSSGALQ